MLLGAPQPHSTDGVRPQALGIPENVRPHKFAHFRGAPLSIPSDLRTPDASGDVGTAIIRQYARSSRVVLNWRRSEGWRTL